MSYKITEEQKKILLQYSAQTLPDNPSRDGFSAEAIRKRMYKPTSELVDLINGIFGTIFSDVTDLQNAQQSGDVYARSLLPWSNTHTYSRGEIALYISDPSLGETRIAFVKSKEKDNVNNLPYFTDGTISSVWWEEIIGFSNYYKKTEVDLLISTESSQRQVNDSKLQTQINKKYEKPSEGIPESDLSQDLRIKVNKIVDFMTNTEVNDLFN